MFRIESCVSCLILAVMLAPVLRAQQAKDLPVAPVPIQIAQAKRVFISNAGVDGISLSIFNRLGDPNKPYNQFYMAMKNWGKYELVNTPSDADLVFEIRFSAPITQSDDKLTMHAPQFGLTIVDTKTHFTLWTLGETVEGAFRKATFVRNLDEAMDRLVSDLKKLASSADAVAMQK